MFSFKVNNILVENGRVKSKWKFNFDWKKWDNENEMNIEKHVEKVINGNVQTKNCRVKKNGNK